jgi:hypothetical protein
MPLCIDTYHYEEEYLSDKDIMIKKKICTIYAVGDGERVVYGGPAVVNFSVSQRLRKSLKNAYVKLGNVPLGWFSSTPEQGIFIKEVPLPHPFRWKLNWPTIDKLVDCDIQKTIEKEFGIDIDLYL